MIEGQCLCGAVYYRYHAEIEKTILCFCQHCRRAQVAAADAAAAAENSDFHEGVVGLSALGGREHQVHIRPNAAIGIQHRQGIKSHFCSILAALVSRLRVRTNVECILPA